MPVVVASYSLEWKPSGSWVALAAGNVTSLFAGTQAALGDNGVGFGDPVATTATVQVLRSAVSGSTWARTPIRFQYTIGASTAYAFVGVIRGWSGNLDTVTFDCSGLVADLSERTKNYYSPLRYRRAPFTKTTASSIEDPANGSYVGGLGNEVAWRAGLRPYEQAGTYPTADGYYSFEQAIRAPDWSWVAGEDGWAECLRLARAVGGQLYQRGDGVVVYRQPLTMIGAAAATYTESDYSPDMREEGRTDSYATAISVAYTPRFVRETQRIVEDMTYRVVGAGETLTIDLEPQWPIYSVVLDGGTLKADNIIATFFDGRLAAYHATTGFTTTTTIYAQRITIALTNNATLPLQISKIQIDGRPVVAGETGTMQVGSGTPAKNLEDNPFVQSKAHAQALASMALAFYGTMRPVRMINVVENPARIVGETINLTSTALGLSAAPHILIDSKDNDTGATMDLSLVDAGGLPALVDYWLIASGAQSGTKKIAW